MNQIGWIDFSRSHYDKVITVMEMFKDQGVIDELGLGTIRDSISDLLFPGTSTIQTRAKYFLLIPWIFQDVEKNGRIERLNTELEQEETHFIKVLRSKPNSTGVIGARLVKANPVRKASSVYWNGLRTYGILNFNRSINDYIKYVQLHYKKQKKQKNLLVEADGNVPGDDLDANHMYHIHLWCQMPQPSQDWKETLTIELNEEEAIFLSERIVRSCPNSLWAYTLKHIPAEAVNFTSISDYLSIRGLPEDFKQLIQLATDFNLIMQGALLRYNLLIQSNRENGRVDKLLSIWKRYFEEMKGFNWHRWNTQSIWKYCPNIQIPTQRFVESWIDLVKDKTYNEIKGDQLIKDRELRLKGIKRARLYDKAIAQKQQSFTGVTIYEDDSIVYLNYRWNTVKTFLIDIQNGLNSNAKAK